MVNYLGLGAKILGLLVLWLGVIFMLWRKFRLDILERQIFSFGLWTTLFVVGIGYYMRVWVGILGILITLGYFSQKFDWDGFEVFDFLMPLVMVFLAIVDLNWVYLMLALTGHMVNINFRKFSWYKSGKFGLSGSVTLVGLGVYLIVYGFKTDFIDQMAGIWLLTGALVSIYLRSKLKLLK